MSHSTVMNIRVDEKYLVMIQEFHDAHGLAASCEHSFLNMEGDERRGCDLESASTWMKSFNIPFSKRARLSIHI